MAKLTGWQMVVQSLKAEGIKYVFGLPGSPSCLYDALYDEPAIKPVLVRHEATGGFMAMAYALLTGEPAVCFASPGPGIANLVPALLEALATCAPVIAPCTGISGHNDGKGAFQETDQVGIMKPVTKWAMRIPYAERIPWAMRRAFSLATNGQPGPIFLEVPVEVGAAQAETGAYLPAERYIRPAGDPARIKQAAQLMAEAKRPLLVAGGGALRSGAHAQVRTLAELLGMPVMTTPSGRSIIPEDHGLSIGQVGLYRTRLGMKAFEEADLLVTVGSRNEEFQTGAWRIFPPGAKYVQIDIESFEIGRHIGIFLVGERAGELPPDADSGSGKKDLGLIQRILAQAPDRGYEPRKPLLNPLTRPVEDLGAETEEDGSELPVEPIGIQNRDVLHD